MKCVVLNNTRSRQVSTGFLNSSQPFSFWIVVNNINRIIDFALDNLALDY